MEGVPLSKTSQPIHLTKPKTKTPPRHYTRDAPTSSVKETDKECHHGHSRRYQIRCQQSPPTPLRNEFYPCGPPNQESVGTSSSGTSGQELGGPLRAPTVTTRPWLSGQEPGGPPHKSSPSPSPHPSNSWEIRYRYCTRHRHRHLPVGGLNLGTGGFTVCTHGRNRNRQTHSTQNHRHTPTTVDHMFTPVRDLPCVSFVTTTRPVHAGTQGPTVHTHGRPPYTDISPWNHHVYPRSRPPS